LYHTEIVGFDQFDISGQIQQFPYDTINMVNIEKIIEGVQKQK